MWLKCRSPQRESSFSAPATNAPRSPPPSSTSTVFLFVAANGVSMLRPSSRSGDAATSVVFPGLVGSESAAPGVGVKVGHRAANAPERYTQQCRSSQLKGARLNSAALRARTDPSSRLRLFGTRGRVP